MSIALREVFAVFGVEFDKKKDLSKGDKQVEALRKRMAKAEKGLDKWKKKAKDAGKSTKDMGEDVKESTALISRFGAALGAAALVEGFRRIIDSTQESTLEAARWADRLGLSERAMYGWIQTAARFGGNVDDITDVLKELQLKARDAMDGTQSYVDIFRTIGLSVSDLAPVVNDQTALMELFTDALNRQTSSATQNFVVDELMSDAGTRLISMFREGTTAIRGYRREADEMGGREFPALARATRQYTLATRTLNQAWEAARNALVLQVMPAMTRGVEKLREWLIAGRAVLENSHLVRASLIVLGGVAAGAATLALIAWGPAILTFVAVAAAVAAAALIIDDLYVTMDGGDSVTRTFLEWALGARGAADAVLFLKTAIDDLGEAIWWLPNFLGGSTTIGEGGQVDVTNVPSAIARAIQEVSFGRGEGAALTPEAAAALPAAQTHAAVRRASEARRAAGVEEQMQEWGLVDAPAPEDLGPQSVPRWERAARRQEVRDRRPSVRGVSTPTRRGRGASVAISAPMQVDVVVNEATDGDVVEQRATAAARAVSEETVSRLAREMSESLTSANELAVIGEGGD